jgi:hypothetical protein
MRVTELSIELGMAIILVIPTSEKISNGFIELLSTGKRWIFDTLGHKKNGVVTTDNEYGLLPVG